MKKLANKLGAFLLAAICALGLTPQAAPTAFAETPAGTSATYADTTVTLTDIATGDVAYAYKVVSYGSTWNTYVFDETNGQGFGQYADAERADQTRDAWLAGIATNQLESTIEDFVSKTSGSAPEFALPAEAQSSTANASGEATLSLQPGYYIIMVKTQQSNSKIYRPLTAFVKVNGEQTTTTIAGAPLPENGKVAVKSTDGPTIDKSVRAASNMPWNKTATASVGDTVQFCIKVTLPLYNDAHLAVDDLGLVLNESMANLNSTGADMKAYKSIDIATGEPSDEIANVATPALNDEGQLASISLNYTTLKGATLANNTFYLVYSATVSPEMAQTNSASNTATLTYKANSLGDTNTTAASATNVYGYSFDVSKVDKMGSTAVLGSSFKVYSSAESTTPLSFVQVGNYYRLAGANDAQATTEIAADAGDGQNAFLIKGLKAGTYYLEESVTPRGYYAPAGRFSVSLVASVASGSEIEGVLDGQESKADSVNDADKSLVKSSVDADCLSVDIINSTTPNLPTTGSVGTIVLTVLGVLLIIAAGAHFVLRRRQH